MLQLMVMRHGKSDWEVPVGSDHDRPLAVRGIRSARLMGRLLTACNLNPDLVVASTASRARTTALLAVESGKWDVQLVEENAIYNGGIRSVLDALSRHARRFPRVLIVGHEPTSSMLVAELTGARVEMKTASVAAVGLMIDSWESVGSVGRLDYLLNPRMFFGTVFDND